MNRIQYLMRRLLFQLQHSENTGLMTLAVLVGLATGAGVWLFRSGIEWFHTIFYERFIHQLPEGAMQLLAPILALTVVGGLIGLLMDRFVGQEKYHGVAAIMESVAYSGGRLPYRKIPFKALAASLSIGAGASVGPEDPSVQIGSNIGSFLGQVLHLPEDRIKILVAAGAAGAIAAAFEAPIAGVFFALEVIMNGTFTVSSAGVIVLASVIASALTQAVDPSAGMGPFTYQMLNPLEIPLYIPLGLMIAPLAVLFIRLVYWQHDFWHHHFDHLPRAIRTAMAGALVATIAVVMPQILGSGHEQMDAVLSGHLQPGLWLLVIIGLVKMGATAISLGGGFVGGVFAPVLVIGTMFGAAYGQLLAGLTIVDHQPQAFAIAGMAAMMAGVVRSPITAIMMVFELTNDYRLILPIMLTTVVCVYLAHRFEPMGIYSLALFRKGVRLPEGRDVDLMQSVLVGEAMLTPAPVIARDATLLELRNTLRENHSNSLCVLDDDGLLSGIVTLSDLQRAFERPDKADLTVGDVCTCDPVTTTPDEVLWQAIRTMNLRDVGRLPVVKPGTRELVGLIGRHGIMRAYNIALNRKLENQHNIERIRLNTLTGAHVAEIHLSADSSIAGSFIADIRWPAECVVAAIRRRGRLIIPHGSTQLRIGDTLVIVGDPRSIDQIELLANHPVGNL